MTTSELPALLLSVAAVITAAGSIVAAVLAWLSSRRNGAAIATVDTKVDGRLTELIDALRAKNVLDKAESFTAGATDQRAAALGDVVTIDRRLPAADAAPPRHPLSYGAPEG